MRRWVIGAVGLAAVAGVVVLVIRLQRSDNVDHSLPLGENEIHAERGLLEKLVVETDTHHQRPNWKTGSADVYAGKVEYHRFLVGGVLWGTQARKLDNNVLDMFQALTACHPWDSITVAGANHAFNIREEPLTYYHRSGPVGAIFLELRTRKGGADAKAPVCVLGLKAGTEACYALPGQKFTCYETDPAIVRLCADTDKYFSYIADARKRKAEIEIKTGNRRDNLAADRDRKYALLLVDPYDSSAEPKGMFTREAVQLYLDRLTLDGIVAIHISSKFVKFELVLSAVARDLGLTARVWNDDGEGKPGKTASSWVILARKPEHLGRLYQPAGDLAFATEPTPGGDDRMSVSMNSEVYEMVEREYPDSPVLTSKRPGPRFADKIRAEWVEWLKSRRAATRDAEARLRLEAYAELLSKPDSILIRSLEDTMLREYGHAFRRLEFVRDVPVWTDERAEEVPALKVK